MSDTDMRLIAVMVVIGTLWTMFNGFYLYDGLSDRVGVNPLNGTQIEPMDVNAVSLVELSTSFLNPISMDYRPDYFYANLLFFAPLGLLFGFIVLRYARGQ